MAAAKYFGNWLRWRSGRQETGYDKMLLAANPVLFPFDCYLLRFRTGSEIPEHRDPVEEKRHYRLNIIIRKAKQGGEFVCSDPIYESQRIKLFRPDMSTHAVTKVRKGTRYVLSIGWVRRAA